MLISAPHKFVTYLLIQTLPTYLQPRDPHGARLRENALTWVDLENG